ncbi:pancreatic secretory granule membrane major glycoprotein GP2 [Sorex araneus]|uniref:pancreatic secretory granule membrane major glycoprotein GP2 n=1 Tax=Sorex araneus TaxID=42254 RepID=UPI002433DA0A|nr:pancreatic secretory granule membrane major glycoprotein GP2 [Sorex araneus]
MASSYILWLAAVCLLTPAATQQPGYRNNSSRASLDCDASGGNCIDPCNAHSVLDDPTRSTEVEAGDEPKCDKDLIGWYRFMGAGGVRLPETCVPMFQCDTLAPMWLNGQHPTVNEGIVSRKTCAHWSNNCCLWEREVQVKACSGGYYVYKLQGTPDCDLRYCTDPSTAQNKCDEVCRPEEECRYENGRWGCFCRQGLNITDVHTLRHKLSCGQQEMKVSLDSCQLGGLGFTDEVSAFLKDRNCNGNMQREEDNWVSMTIPTQATACGNILENNGTHAVYKNTLSLANDLIIRDNVLSVNFQCSYPLDMEASLGTALQPIVSTVSINASGNGEFTVRMAAFQDPNYRVPYEGDRVVLPVESMLYVGAMLESGDTSRFKLLLRNCYATPSRDKNDPVKYFIIKNKCPNQFDPTVSVVENGVSANSRFSVQMFMFAGDSDLVFLHCEAYLCDPLNEQCVPTCYRNQFRSAVEAFNPDRVLDLGPIARKGGSPVDVTSGSPGTTGFLAAWLVLLLPVLLAAALC